MFALALRLRLGVVVVPLTTGIVTDTRNSACQRSHRVSKLVYQKQSFLLLYEQCSADVGVNEFLKFLRTELPILPAGTFSAVG